MSVEEKEVELHKGIVETELTRMKKEESKEALSDSSSDKKIVGEPESVEELTPEQVKTQEDADKVLLEKDEADLTDDDKARLATIEEERVKENAKPTNLDKRFGELTGKNKDLARTNEKLQETLDRTNDSIAALEAKIAELEKAPVIKESKETIGKQVEQERIQKYLSEDEGKERADKREMSDEAWDDWFLEEPRQANEWLFARNTRRLDERRADKANATKETSQKELARLQKESGLRANKRHPELNPSGRIKELREEGLNDKQIHKAICKENDKYRIVWDVVDDHPEYMKEPNAPELIATEMEKRLAKEKEEPKESEEDKTARLKAEAIEEERLRQESIDEGITSTASKLKAKGEQSPMYKKQLAAMVKSGGTKEDLDAMLKRRSKIPGASQRD